MKRLLLLSILVLRVVADDWTIASAPAPNDLINIKNGSQLGQKQSNNLETAHQVANNVFGFK